LISQVDVLREQMTTMKAAEAESKAKAKAKAESK
jgi:hypothetical protein